MTRFMIFGSGRQGIACADFLLSSFDDTQICFADRSVTQLQAALDQLDKPERISTFECDISHDNPQLHIAVSECDCVISCVPYFFNERLATIALKRKKHFCDLGGNNTVVENQLNLDAKAAKAGISIVPDCGLAPGWVNILAEYWQDQWQYESVKIYCGGLPQHPKGIWKYEANFSIHGLINEYLEDCEISRGGTLVKIPGMSELERLDDFALKGEFEAFATSGGASVAPKYYAPKQVDYFYPC